MAYTAKDYAKLIELVLKHALTSQRQQVQQVMNGLYLARVPLYEIYDQLLSPVMHRIGALWLDKKVTIIEEDQPPTVLISYEEPGWLDFNIVYDPKTDTLWWTYVMKAKDFSVYEE